ncbi:MAG TPA: hypothetical protein VFM54_11210 [Micromonosporaceae bacterium]|nr:hypothetical protein [Micromonosporaceae bacterium]
MRVVFPRLPDHTRGYALVERDDRVTYRLGSGPASAALPHDLVHLLVEDSLGISDGIWGAIAGGVVFRSMTHVAGRRPPHAAQRSAAIKRQYGPALRRAELLGGFVERLARGGFGARVDVDGVRRLTHRWLTTEPDLTVDPAAVLRAVVALGEAAGRWRALEVGEEYVFRWPAHRRVRLDLGVAGAGSAARRGGRPSGSSRSSRHGSAGRRGRAVA